MQGRLGAGLAAVGGAIARALLGGAVMPRTFHTLQCIGPDGQVKWEETIENLTVNTGLADMLSKYWKGSNYTGAFYAGLKGTGTIAATDTMASHAGWTEVQGYSQAARPALVLGSVTGTTTASLDNSASVASYSINATVTVAGAFITTDSTKGGTAGILIGASDFATPRSMGAGDTLNLTTSFTNTSG
ncbi:hypothetical protein MMSR116_29080 [Methylobacterium mesophilicum SR1.6/6]|uniref:Uncharacterized protein n=1 Tax=Methylobacterium mesophilicum SR1.6/6 TaxID=908290 RepID=A0A6B9FS36_9HYPH|nr:hypothetical protein [Methylobacterium mesophilicum]QGY05493.1 hypothetical protein MMSR116_29080 [Methylobacterium mesophilicum SR1.6/6]